MIDTIVIEAPATRMPRMKGFRVYNISEDLRSRVGVLGRGYSGTIKGTYARRTFRDEKNNIVYTCFVLRGDRLPQIRVHIPSLPKLRYGHNLWGPATAEEFVSILSDLQTDLALQGIRVDLMVGTIRRLDICTTLEFATPIRAIMSFLRSATMGSEGAPLKEYETGIGFYSTRVSLQIYDAVARYHSEIQRFPDLLGRNLLRIESQFRNLNQRQGMQRYNTIAGIIHNYASLREVLIGKFFSVLLRGFEQIRFQNGYTLPEVKAFVDSKLQGLVRTPIQLIRSVAMETFLEYDHSGYYVREALGSTLEAHGFGNQRKEGYYRTLFWVVMYRALNGSIARPEPSQSVHRILNEIIEMACAFGSEERSIRDTVEADATSSSSAASDNDSSVDLIQPEG